MTTLTQLKTRIRERVDKTGSTFISESELTSLVNASYAELYGLIVGANQDYFVSSPVTFTLATVDAGIYALPSGFFKFRGVDWYTNGEYIPLRPFGWNERGSAFYPNYAYDTPSYRIVGSNLRLEPTDNAPGTYRLWYVPAYTPLSAGSDTIDTVISRNNWEEYIVMDVGIKILNKEESNADHLVQAKQLFKADLLASLAQRDLDNPESISDVRAGSDFFYV